MANGIQISIGKVMTDEEIFEQDVEAQVQKFREYEYDTRVREEAERRWAEESK
jgi:hypothetical protein